MARTRKPASTLVTVFLASVVAGAALAGGALAYLRWQGALGGRFEPAAVGLVFVALAVILAGGVMRLRKMVQRGVAIAALSVLGLVGCALAWLLRLSPDSVSAADAVGAADAIAGLLSAPGPLELYVTFASEAVLIGVLAVAMSTGMTARLCNWCEAPCEILHDAARRVPAPAEEVRDRLAARDWLFFRNLGPPPADAREYIRFDLGSCTCGLTRTVWVTHVRPGLDVALVKDCRQTPEDVRTIRGFGIPDDPWYSSEDRQLSGYDVLY